MRVFIFGLYISVWAASVKCAVVTHQESLNTIYRDTGIQPNYTELKEQYRKAMHNFTITIYKIVAFRGNFHFVMSPHALWMTLAAVAEGADSENQQQLFDLLRLPSDSYLRQSYYHLAGTRFPHTPDVNTISFRALVIDEGVIPNPKWHHFVTKHALLEVVSAPIRRNTAAAANVIRQVVSANFPQLSLHGNSVLLDTLDYNGLWTTAFAHAVVKRAPFYDRTGQQIGSVDFMRVKRHGKIGYVDSLKAKVLELPVGLNGQYSMVFALIVGDLDLAPVVRNFKASIVSEVLVAMKDSEFPIDLAIPQFTINSEMDAKTILQDLNITKLWTDPAATRYISYPPALPSSYVQRTTVTLHSEGIYNPPLLLRSYGPDSEDQFSSEFIADRPFMFGLFDTETYTLLTATMFTKPTYPN